MPSAMAVFPTPGSPIRHGLFFRRRTSVRTHDAMTSSRPYTSSNSPLLASSVRSCPHSFRVGVAPSPPPLTPVTNSAPPPPPSSTSLSSARQNSPARNASESMPSVRNTTASAPLANPSSSTEAAAPNPPSSDGSNSSNASRMCSERMVGESAPSASLDASVRTLLRPGVKGNSTSRALRFMLNMAPNPPPPPPLPPSPSLSPPSSLSANIPDTAFFTLRGVMPYRFSVLLAFSGRSTTPSVMISVPTDDWPNRADSFWAVTSAPIASSDIRSNSIDRDVVDLAPPLLPPLLPRSTPPRPTGPTTTAAELVRRRTTNDEPPSERDDDDDRRENDAADEGDRDDGWKAEAVPAAAAADVRRRGRAVANLILFYYRERENPSGDVMATTGQGGTLREHCLSQSGRKGAY
mmetsp:Transcript_6009/g.17543  ORF Transcript_6009/g.17543 Transcript_6009/m.17543 type:complete len:407 (+) Transcript_6009:2935-4155(+)